MTKTIAVVRGEKRGTFKVLVNYIQRGVTVHSAGLANQEAIKISENEPHDHLILAKEEA
jgi:hypothetical protein